MLTLGFDHGRSTLLTINKKYTTDVRSQLMAAGVPEEHEVQLAAGKRTRPISRAALRTTTINVGGIVKEVDVDALFDKVHVCKEMLDERIAKHVSLPHPAL
jgi:hypothetical protein